MWQQLVSGWRAGLILVAADLVGLVFIFSVVYHWHIGQSLDLMSPSLAGVTLVTLLGLYLADVYRAGTGLAGFSLPIRTIVAVAIVGGFIAALIYLLPGQTRAAERDPVFWRGVLPVAMFFFAIWAAMWRVLLSLWLKWLARNLNWLVLGSGECARHLWRDFKKANSGGELFFLTPQGPGSVDWGACNPVVVGRFDDLDKCTARRWAGIVIATDTFPEDQLVNKLMQVRLQGVRVYDLTDFYERFLSKIPVLNLRDGWFALSHGFDLLHHDVQHKIKRLIDIVLAVILLVVASPVMLLVAVAILLNSRGPVFYSQKRTGLNGNEFYVHKFRTMINNAEEGGAKWAEEDDPRITWVGRYLRAWRIDELPQIWNVIKGEMSFIGPRPERPDFNGRLETEIPYYDLRHLVKPGISGWAQVNYSYGSSIEDAREKLQYDLYYIKNYSLLLDAAIAFKTLRVVLFGRGR